MKDLPKGLNPHVFLGPSFFGNLVYFAMVVCLLGPSEYSILSGMAKGWVFSGFVCRFLIVDSISLVIQFHTSLLALTVLAYLYQSSLNLFYQNRVRSNTIRNNFWNSLKYQ